MSFKFFFSALLAYFGIINDGAFPVCDTLSGSLFIIINPGSSTNLLIVKSFTFVPVCISLSKTKQILSFIGIPNAKSYNGMYLPRSTSYAAVSQSQMEPNVQYGQFTVPPGFAGGLPYMKNAIREDQNIIMNPYGEVVPPVLAPPLNTNKIVNDWNQIGMYPKPTTLYQPEGFRYTNGSTTQNEPSITCNDVKMHMLTCSGCQRLYSYERKLWITIIIMIVLVFLIIIYLLERRTK
jgi:hypothetical protein